MNASSRTVVLALVAALAGAAVLASALGWLPGGSPRPVDPAPALPVDELPPEGPAPASGTVVVLPVPPRPEGIADEDCIAYPDGTLLPPLNGVTKAPRITFHRRLPFTPVVGVKTDARGVQWYVHQNGAWSTTRYQLRDGQREAVGEVLMPTTPSTVLDK